MEKSTPLPTSSLVDETSAATLPRPQAVEAILYGDVVKLKIEGVLYTARLEHFQATKTMTPVMASSSRNTSCDQLQGISFLTLGCTTFDVKQLSSNPDCQEFGGHLVVHIPEHEIKDNQQESYIPGGLLLRGPEEFPADIRDNIIHFRCMVCRQVFT